MLRRGLNDEKAEERQEVKIEAQAQDNFEPSGNAKKGGALIRECENLLQQLNFMALLEKTNALLQMDDVKNNPPIVQYLQNIRFALQKLALIFPQGLASWRSAKAGERRVLNIDGARA
ncbi:MAG: hypothetical protein IJE97_14005 [Thermoguttaceae bacterium]|nr:hypothetical protein [Thermoguttaceae bacterium]MBQ6826963.1 hypothetical protein [Thermoguttaceae bacterium]MBQ7111944.1 hypothetical protein [Thermoguttaceae bacterium]